MIALTLSQLARAVGGEVLLAPGDTPDTVVSGAVDTDSRLMGPGGIFVARFERCEIGPICFVPPATWAFGGYFASTFAFAFAALGTVAFGAGRLCLGYKACEVAHAEATNVKKPR